jgi:hypothetical protein
VTEDVVVAALVRCTDHVFQSAEVHSVAGQQSQELSSRPSAFRCKELGAPRQSLA